MTHNNSEWLEHQLKRWMRPDAHYFVRADWRRYVRPGFERDHPFGLYERKYDPNQPRVPAGDPAGGQWTSDRSSSVGRNDPRVISDATPDPVRPRVQYARNLQEHPTQGRAGPLANSPPGVNVDANIAQAENHKEDYFWFYSQVRNKGPWDYKQLGKDYADFGNFNYGATGRAAGFSEGTLLRMAGWAQVQAGTSQANWGTAPSLLQALLGVGGKAPYGDDPKDQIWILRGIRYYEDTNRKR